MLIFVILAIIAIVAVAIVLGNKASKKDTIEKPILSEGINASHGVETAEMTPGKNQNLSQWKNFKRDFRWEIENGVYYLVCLNTEDYLIMRIIGDDIPVKKGDYVDPSFTKESEYFRTSLLSPIDGIQRWLLSDDHQDEWDICETRIINLKIGQKILKIDPTQEGYDEFVQRHEARRLKIQEEKEKQEKI